MFVRLAFLIVVLLAACAQPETTASPPLFDALSLWNGPRPVPRPNQALADDIDALASAPPPPDAARTAEDFDTTTRDQRVAASTNAATDGDERALGDVVASLGDVTEPGLWLKTALVRAEVPGRVEDPATGRSVLVRLVPADGGSRLSLAAFRILDLPLTDLPTLAVFAR